MATAHPAPREIDAAIKSVAKRHHGFGGNCAAFAATLNRVFGGDGSYLIVNGGHYEFADHVMVNIRGRLFDASGLLRREGVRREWCGDGEKLETYYDPSPDGEEILRLCGIGFGDELDPERLEADLLAFMGRVGEPAAAPGPA